MATRELRVRRTRSRTRRTAGACLLVAGVSSQAACPRPRRARKGAPACARRSPSPIGKHSAPILSGSDVWSFVSDPALHPMRVKVTANKPGTARGDIFVAPFSADQMVGQTGALINDNSGDPVWFRPLPSTNLQNADFKVQTYYDGRRDRGQPVLTWWQGTLALPPAYTNLPAGAPEQGGCYYIYDRHYRLLKTVFAHHGCYPDEHEFTLTRRGTALFIASKPVPMDLTPYGGPKNGAIENSEIQEVDLATGRLLFSWNALDHLDPADSEEPVSSASSSDGVWDAFHINSVDEGPDGRLLISARNMWAIYDVTKRSGRIRYQIGGRKSDFTFGPNADFYWQHDARFRPGNRISMFDDGCCDLPDGTPEQVSHGLILNLDVRSRKATVDRTYYHQPPLESPTQGNTQALSNGNEFIGWAKARTTRSTRVRGTPRATACRTCSTTRSCRAPTSRTERSGTNGSARRTTHRVPRHGPTADTASSTPPGTARRRPEHGGYSPDPTPTPCRSLSDAPHAPDSRQPSPRTPPDRTSR
ncbi:hypothetical protein SAV31267_097260 [Streptomyces avermitilis]|uniref:Secreted protein n=1 Tax=Streptomyces avermitilis TaxID=33903 RepID=A0A4D4N6P8_STRAX|nr:hypothetical protein SAV31267_097260 [Streptomyces avermitilis]